MKEMNCLLFSLVVGDKEMKEIFVFVGWIPKLVVFIRVNFGSGVSGGFKIGSFIYISFYIIFKSGSVKRSGKFRVCFEYL